MSAVNLEVTTNPEEQENYLRMLFLVFDIGTSAKRSILANHLIKNGLNSFEDFINKNQHDIYHYFDNKKCCLCTTDMSSTKTVLLPHQIQLIFDINRNQRKCGHSYGKNNRFCCLKAANISLKELDFTLLRFFIINFCDDLIWDDCLQSYKNNFETFLDREKHNLYHMWKSNTACCLCRTGYVPPKQCIHSDKQYHLMFQLTKNSCNDDTCGYSVLPGLTYDKLKNDDKLLFFNLTIAFCPLRKAIEILTTERNNLAHALQLRLDQASFERSWNDVTAAIERIASTTNTLIDVRENIRDIKEKHFDVRLCQPKLENMLRENQNMQDVSGSIEIIVEDLKEMTETRICQLEDTVRQNSKTTEKVYAFLDRLSIEGNLLNRDQIEITTQDLPASMTHRMMSAVWASTANVVGWFLSTARKIVYKKDEEKDSFKCGPCQNEFNRIEDFLAHKDVCVKRTKKCTSDRCNTPADKYLNVTVKGMSETWEKQTLEYSKENMRTLNVDGAEVLSGEPGSLFFWIKSSAAALSSSSLDSLMNRFLKNMFRTCPVEENKDVSVEVTVDIFEEISDVDEDGDIYGCGLCKYECSSFTSFLRHKTDKCQTNQENSNSNRDTVLVSDTLAEHDSFPFKEPLQMTKEEKEKTTEKEEKTTEEQEKTTEGHTKTTTEEEKTTHEQEKTTEKQEKRTEEQEKTTEEQEKTTGEQEKTTGEQEKTTEEQEKTTEKQEKRTEEQEKTTEEPKKTTGEQEKTTEEQEKTTEEQEKTTEEHEKTTEEQEKTTKGQENFYRLLTLIVDETKDSIFHLLEYYLTKEGITLQRFIETNGHVLYDMFCRYPCCQCPSYMQREMIGIRVLQQQQLDILLDPCGKKLPGHNPRCKSDPRCCSPVNPNLKLQSLDFTLARLLLVTFTNIVPSGSFERNALDNLVSRRETSFVHAKAGSIPDDEYEKSMAEIEKSLLVLAKVYGKEEETTQRLRDIAKQPFNSNIFRQLQNILLQQQNTLLQECQINEFKELLHMTTEEEKKTTEEQEKTTEEQYEETLQMTKIKKAKIEKSLLVLAKVYGKEEETKQRQRDIAKRPLNSSICLQRQDTLHQQCHTDETIKQLLAEKQLPVYKASNMTTQEQQKENFYRHSTGIVDESKDSFLHLLEFYLRKAKLTLPRFIEINAHVIYHMCYNRYPCCQCPSNIRSETRGSKVLQQQQLDILLDPCGEKLPVHNPCSKSAPQCCSPVNPHLQLQSLDFTLARLLLVSFTNIVPNGSVERNALDNLVKIRNESFAHAKEGRISNDEYRKSMAEIEKSLLVLAKIYGKETETKQRLRDIAKQPLNFSICVQLQNTLLQQLQIDETIKQLLAEKQLPDCLTKDVCDVKVTEGCDAHFEIWTKKNDLCSSWLQNGKEIVRSNKFIPGISGDIHSLDIINTCLFDKGLYTVRVKDIERQARLEIEAYFTKNLQSVTIIEGGTAEFTCEVKEDSLPACWSKNGINFENDRKYEILQAGKTHKLSIKNCDQHDTAKYTVSINNRVREASLVVIEYINKSLETRICKEGENVHFDCEVLEYHQQAAWFKDDREVNTLDRFKVERHAKLHRLVVNNTRLDDQGEYSVKIKNCVRSYKLRVQGSQDERFKQQKCGICHKEPPVYWCHDCQRAMCKDCNKQHFESTDTDTKSHIVQHVQDTYSLSYIFKVNIEFINDIKVLHDDVLIISDLCGKQLFTGQQQHFISLCYEPCYIAVVDRNTVAITLNDSIVIPTAVEIIDVRHKTIIQHIEVKVACYGIIDRDNQLFVGCGDRTIKVMNMSGEVAHAIPVHVIPYYMCVGEAGRIFYTTKLNNNLFCIDTEGNSVFTFTHPNMNGPLGITTDDEGHVLVMCRGSNNVLRISPDGKHSQVIISQIPWSEWSPYICYNSLSKSIVIGRHDKIYIFKKV